MDCGGDVIDMQMSYNAFDVYEGSDWDTGTKSYIFFIDFIECVFEIIFLF